MNNLSFFVVVPPREFIILSFAEVFSPYVYCFSNSGFIFINICFYFSADVNGRFRDCQPTVAAISQGIPAC